MAKQLRVTTPAGSVRTRRAYFDCRYGQLHVRTAFPTTGGFNEGVTLLCLHPAEGSSRTFTRFLPQIAVDRSVYAPDLPGYGESDPPAAGQKPVDLQPVDAARAVADFAADLRLRQIDIVGYRFGAAVALELTAAKPDLVRRLVLIEAPSTEDALAIKAETLWVKTAAGQGQVRATHGQSRLVDLSEHGAEVVERAPAALAQQVSAFLGAA